MKFTKATKENKVTITLGKSALYINDCLDHPKDKEIRAGLKAAGYSLIQIYDEDTGYTVQYCTNSELKQVESELKSAYGLIEPVEDVALLSRIAIEIAIGARIADRRGQSLTNENFPPGYDVVKAAQTDGFMKVCLETARNVLMILK